jgi:putative restriction endonuclease
LRFFVAITDSEWYKQLAAIRPDEVNFWQPSGSSAFRALSPGELFLFKLHSPDEFIVGGGLFSHFTLLPASFAWSAFEQKNGATSEQQMRKRIEQYRRSSDSIADYVIGCIVLTEPFFFDRAQWIPIRGWHRSIVRGKTYDTSEADGLYLWSALHQNLAGHIISSDLTGIETPAARLGMPQLVVPRLGQGAFRVLVTDSYARQCAFTNSHVLHVLDAAHIKPYSVGGEHRPTNGILLRQDLHTLFDRGYVTVTPDYRIEVSPRIKEEFNNGKDYYAMHGRTIHLPERPEFRPDPEVLRWHNESIFRS